MLKSVYEFKFDLAMRFRTPEIVIMQNDTDVNILNINLTINNTIVDLTDCTVVLRFVKEDNSTPIEGVADIVDATNGKIHYNIGTSEIAKIGEVRVYVIIYGSNNERKTSNHNFKILVKEDFNDPNAIQSATDYPILTALITQNQSLLSAENTRQSVFEANESVRETNESDRQTAEINRQTAETERQNVFTTNEATRQSQEISRVNAESSRVTAENTRQTNEVARQQLKSAMDTLKSTLELSETTRQGNEDTRVVQESQRITEFEGIKNNMDVTSSKPLSVVRSQQVVNPMSSYNYVGGYVIDADKLVEWDSGATEPNYASDIQIINDEIIYKTDFGKKLEKFFKDIMGLSQ